MTEKEFRNKLINVLLLAGDMATDELNHAINRIGIILKKYRNNNSLDIWYGNSHLKKQIEDILNEYSNRVFKLTEANIKGIWELSEKKNDIITSNMMVGVAGTTIYANKLYRYFNRIIPQSLRPNLKIKIKKSTIKEVTNAPRNVEALNTFLNRKVDGLQLSERVWKLTDSTVKPLIESYLSEGIKSGASAADISRDIRKYLNSPDSLFRRVRDTKGKLKLSKAAKDYTPGQGVYRSAYKNAMRLAKEEVNQAYRAADHERWKQMDIINGIKISPSESHFTRMPGGDICDELAGEYPKDFMFPGWHVGCLCYATAITLPKEQFIKRLQGEDVEMKPVQIPEKFTSYVESHKEQIEGWKSKPYWYSRNRGFTEK